MKTYHCVGFTTDGVLRKEIDQPYAWRGAGHSLYVLGTVNIQCIIHVIVWLWCSLCVYCSTCILYV